MSGDHRNGPERARYEALRQAADWFAALQSPDADARTRQRWSQWLEAHLAHREAWTRVEAIGQRFAVPEELCGLADLTLSRAERRQQERRRALKLLTLAGGSAALMWGFWRTPVGERLVAGLGADHATDVGETRELELADGTQLWLNTDSAVATDYGAQLRRVRLRRGEILIDTAADRQAPARPFVVDSAQGRLRALGTRFVVRQLDAATLLSVFDGRVEVQPRHGEAQIVAAGEQLRFTDSAAGTREPASSARQAWARGVLLAEDLPLGEFVAELSRYRRGYLGCDPAIAGLRVVGGFPLLEPDRALRLLQAALPVQVHAPLPWWVSIGPR